MPYFPPPVDSSLTGFTVTGSQAVTQPVTAGASAASAASTGWSAGQMSLLGAGISGAAGIAGAAIIGSSGVKQAQIAADAQKYQYTAELQAQKLDNEFSKTILSYVPQLALMGAATVFAIVAIKELSE